MRREFLLDARRLPFIFFPHRGGARLNVDFLSFPFRSSMFCFVYPFQDIQGSTCRTLWFRYLFVRCNPVAFTILALIDLACQ